jgi:hypothetical protein
LAVKTKKNTRTEARARELSQTSDIAAESGRNILAVQEITNKVSKKIVEDA